ncbi:hypothetical protein D1Q00_gp032 [Trichoplusia ni granulovirus LBIV-12]|uniref:Uncharacterized protein n=2 Tax=Betabaculovirus TaxID=558017 RepID=A0A1D8QL39_GVTN|nr:hypothetical protein PsunGV_gp035 [Pseudalatia unipuncta granulovirus]YP_009506102.1 hypothetical protein D1Q00_gp032 [Trichoplusia ni granulovirus LBIV-12]ACH69385.1 unknown [Pseudalatia unipuncta granulovirus]AOW41371.1 hypothetical protein [Trichoplusia ni granulovirus LBIV-12]
MERLLKLLYLIDNQVNTAHPINYDVSGSDPEINHDRFGRCLAADLYLEAMEIYENIDTKSIVVDSPFSDKMKLFLQVLHFMYPEWDDVLLNSIPFAGISESNFAETVKLIRADDEESGSDDEDDGKCMWFYRFSMK